MLVPIGVTVLALALLGWRWYRLRGYSSEYRKWLMADLLIVISMAVSVTWVVSLVILGLS